VDTILDKMKKHLPYQIHEVTKVAVRAFSGKQLADSPTHEDGCVSLKDYINRKTTSIIM
jgi:hypothetical protein